jgi:hypothetical protein
VCRHPIKRRSWANYRAPASELTTLVASLLTLLVAQRLLSQKESAKLPKAVAELDAMQSGRRLLSAAAPRAAGLLQGWAAVPGANTFAVRTTEQGGHCFPAGWATRAQSSEGSSCSAVTPSTCRPTSTTLSSPCCLAHPQPLQRSIRQRQSPRRRS